tara:strand:- start:262 stop:948 length:687 start_codon:yes stop_codon:yes gene_type:complete
VKKIGVLGGTSYPSTVLYYKLLNELYNQKMGGFHSCPMILQNIDYHEIKSRYNSSNGWNEIPILLKQEIESLISLNPDCLIIANNTLHKAFDIIKAELNLQIPIFHIIELTADYITKNNLNQILLLGTKFTMQDDFFKGYLKKQGIKVITPSNKEMDEIQTIQTSLSKGNFKDDYPKYFEDLYLKYQECDGIILGCTELPLAFDSIKIDHKINTIELQCQKAIDFIVN